MPTFRGEEVDERHLSQFFHSEAEMVGGLDDVMALVDSYIKHLSGAILRKYGSELQSLIGSLNHIEWFISNEIPRYTLDEVSGILLEKYPDKINDYIANNGTFRNITNLGEKAIMEIVGSPIWITRYDKMAVPFYQKRDETNPKLAKNADLLLGIGETVGCGERNATSEEVIASLSDHQVGRSAYEWYISLRKKYPLQTSGFGMGVERFLLFILKHNDIRDVQVIRRFNDGRDIV